MNLYIKNKDIYSFYFRFILFLFLEENKIFEYVDIWEQNRSYDNIFVVKNIETKRNEIIVFFKYETSILQSFINSKELSIDTPINVFYLSNRTYHNNSNNARLNIRKESLEHKFLNKLHYINEQNFLSIVNEYSHNQNFLNIMKGFSYDALTIKESVDTIYYKYKGSNGYRVQEMIDGEFTYVSPNCFNDPFDCDFEEISFIDGSIEVVDKKDMFRVLCITPIMDNILMWGYYGNNHDGIVVGHRLSDYLNETTKVYKGLIIYGEVSYEKDRPNYKHYRVFKSLPFFVFLSDIIECCFTKFLNWQHEKEFRILTFLEGFNEFSMKDGISQNNFINIKGNTYSLYIGAKYSSTNKFVLPSFSEQLEKDDKEYKLNVK